MAVEPDYTAPVSSRAVERSFNKGGTAAFLFGVAIGAAAGLIGVGGGEFRIPVLLRVLRLAILSHAIVSIPKKLGSRIPLVHQTV
jgi:uncharacterized membrane protein YfcA